MWAEAVDDLLALERDIKRVDAELTIDQRLQLLNIKANLALGQELSAINPQNYSGADGSGRRVNGWGLPV